MWNLSSQTRDGTWALGSERAGSLPLDCQGIPNRGLFNVIFREKRRRHTQSDGDVKMEGEIGMLAATETCKRHGGTPFSRGHLRQTGTHGGPIFSPLFGDTTCHVVS